MSDPSGLTGAVERNLAECGDVECEVNARRLAIGELVRGSAETKAQANARVETEAGARKAPPGGWMVRERDADNALLLAAPIVVAMCSDLTARVGLAVAVAGYALWVSNEGLDDDEDIRVRPDMGTGELVADWFIGVDDGKLEAAQVVRTGVFLPDNRARWSEAVAAAAAVAVDRVWMVRDEFVVVVSYHVRVPVRAASAHQAEMRALAMSEPDAFAASVGVEREADVERP